MFSTLQIMTNNGWRPINLFRQTNLDRDAADVAMEASQGILADAKAMPDNTDRERQNRHLAIMAAHSATIKADSFRKGARRYERQ